MKYFFLTLLISSSVFAQSRITFNQVFNRGDGCPEGTVSAVPSPDGSSVSFLFDQFQVEIPSRRSGNQYMGRAHCLLRFSSVLPEGTEAYGLDISVNGRGFTSLESGLIGSVTTQLEGLGGLAQIGRPMVISKKTWAATSTDVSDDWTTTPTVNLPLPARCSGRTANKIDFSLTTLVEARNTGRTTRHGSIVVDSIDTSGFIKITLKTRSCRATMSPIRRYLAP